MMKTNILKIVLMVSVVMLMAGCSTTSPRTFEHVVASAEKNGDKYDEADWERADANFDRFCQYYDYERLKTMSEEEQREVGRLMARYTKARAKSAMKDLDGFLKTGASLLKGFFEGLGLEEDEEGER